jgi:hypothetical protein
MNHELSPEARSLIREALTEEPRPNTSHRDRLRRRVLARAAAGGVVTLVGSSIAKASARSLLSVVASSLGLGFGAGLVLVSAAQVVFSPSARLVSKQEVPAASAHSPKTLDRAPSPRAKEAALPTPMASFAPGPAPVIAPAQAKAHISDVKAAAEPSAGSGLRAELDLMAQVQEALRDAHGGRALELIAQYDARHPSGVLETERLAAEVFAACQIGDRARASRVAQRFLARDSSSALATRVKNACPTENELTP